MTDNKERAQACPFCGGTENLLSSNGVASHYVFCNSYDCGAEGPVRETEDGAISAWNARSALAASQEKAEPVAYVDGDDSLRRILWEPDQAAFNLPVGTKLYAAPVAAQADEDAHIEAILDAADEWADYVDVDRAPMTLRKYLERALRASKGEGDE